MLETDVISFKIDGWLDFCDISYSQNYDSGCFTLYGNTDDNIPIMCDVSLYDESDDSIPTIKFHKDDKDIIGSIHVVAILHQERFNQLYSTLSRHHNNLNKIEVFVSLGTSDDSKNDESFNISYISFQTEIGDYFSDNN